LLEGSSVPFSLYRSRSSVLVRSVVVVLAVAISPLSLAGTAHAAEAAAPSGQLHGVVEDESGLPLAGTTVRLVDATGGPVAEVSADSLGRYSLSAPQGT
jgi:hypothetical protein